MPLTTAQLATLKTNITSSFPGEPMNDDANFAIAVAYNALASPAFRVWRTAIPAKEVKQNIVWTEFITRSAGERDAFQFMLSEATINGADTNIRQGFADMFSGAGGATTRAALLAMSKRDATRAEKLFATGTGSDASPATMTFEGQLTYSDIGTARNS